LAIHEKLMVSPSKTWSDFRGASSGPDVEGRASVSTLLVTVSTGPGFLVLTVKWRMFVPNARVFSVAPAMSTARSAKTYSPGVAFRNRCFSPRIPIHFQPE